MFTVKATKHNLGVEIAGGCDDLQALYEGISRLCSIDEAQYEGVQNRLFAFLYELRNTYQGNRNIQIKEEEMLKNQKEIYSEVKEFHKLNYMNRFLWTEILFVIFALEDYKTLCLTDKKHFITENKELQPVYASLKAQNAKDLALASYFQECVWDALAAVITEIRVKSLKKLLRERKLNYKGYCPQAIDFMNKRVVQAFAENRAKVVAELARNMIKKDAGYDELETSIRNFADENGIAYFEVDFEGNEIENYESLLW